MKELEFSDVSVRRNRAEVLTSVSFTARAGEITAILGSNGVGKSTTLRTISGLHRPHTGVVKVDGQVVNGMPPHKIVRMGIAHVPEGRQIFPGLTILENLEIAARIDGGLTADKKSAVFTLFPILSDFKSRKAGVLSGGQQQMLAIARGIVAGPDLILMDEPSLGLAPKVVGQITDVIQELVAQGLGVLLVEQNAAMALDIAAHGYLMAGGRIVMAGTAEELKRTDAVRDVYLGN